MMRTGVFLIALAASLMAGGANSAGPAAPSPIVTANAHVAAVDRPAPIAAIAEATGPSLDLAATEAELGQLRNQMQAAPDDRRLAAIAARAAGLEAASQTAVVAWTRDLRGVTRLLARRPPHARTGPTSGERAALSAQRTALQGQILRARRVTTYAQETFSLVAERRREGFSTRVLEQSASPLSPEFWSALRDSLGPDFARLASLAQDAVDVAAQAPEPQGGIAACVGLVLAIILLWPLHWGVKRLAAAFVSRRGSFGRMAYAVCMTIIDVAAPVAAMTSLRLSATWGGLLSQGATAIADALVVAVGWGAAVIALGRAIATDRNPDRCIAPAPEGVATRLRRLVWLIAVVTGGGYLLSRLNYVVGASVAATVASNAILALGYAAVAGLTLVAFSGARARRDQTQADAWTPWWSLVSLALGALILTTVGAVLAGFTTLAALISGQVFWCAVIAAAGLLLVRLAAELAAWLFRPRGWASGLLVGVFRLRQPVVAQLGVLTAAALQVGILGGALSLALTPFGETGQLLPRHLGAVGQGVRLGAATISPRAIISGVGAFAIGMALAHALRRWLVRRYLPVTGWDAGVRNSVSTGVGYIGAALAVLGAMAAMGLGLRQIALVASALSVGIGFGLQQIVQNFVSGVILLVERPVKVGDWVNVGGVEGDIRRIRVRATEIQTFDRTTVIVPNSDLITKQVQNKTRGDPRARVQLDLSIASPADAVRAREIVLDIAEHEPEVLEDPKPAVYIDSLAAGGAVVFKAYVFVANPRDVTRIRSQMYFAALDRFRTENIGFIGVAGSQNLVVEPGPGLSAALQSLAGRGPKSPDGEDPTMPESSIPAPERRAPPAS
jgi:potassium efflux system protein